jgi:hypothetical protein
MAAVRSRQGMSQIAIRAVITRADGTVEDLGTISYWNKNPLRRLAYRIGRLFKWRH